MLNITIPGRAELHLEHLFLDFNGTLAQDGVLLTGVPERLGTLARNMRINILTADTFGSVADQTAGLDIFLHLIPPQRQDEAKLAIVRAAGSERSACIGNGRNDMLMLEHAALGIACCQAEGAHAGSMLVADVICHDIRNALDLLINPQRLIATLRN